MTEQAWQTIGTVSTGNGTLAIVPPYYANTLGKWWDERVETLHADRMGNFEAARLEQITSAVGGRAYPDSEQALLVSCENGTYDVEARFCDLYDDGHLTICELRIVLHNVEHEANER